MTCDSRGKSQTLIHHLLSPTRFAAIFFLFANLFWLYAPKSQAASCTPIDSSYNFSQYQIWSDNCYELSGLITIPADTTLVITPEVNISSPNLAQLIINGSLSAVGTSPESRDITFDKINITFNSQTTNSSIIQSAIIYGSLIIESGATPQIQDNLIQSPDTAITATNFSGTIANNTIQAAQTAIELFGDNKTFLHHNHIGSSDIGLILRNSVSAEITNNTITDNGVGLLVETENPVILRDNDIYQNQRPRLHAAIPAPQTVIPAEAGIQSWETQNFGLYVVSTRSTPVDAPENWWGSHSGPAHPANPSGQGEKISDYVNFTPWLGGFANIAIEPDTILLTEIFPSPATGGTKGEWVELYNTLDMPIFLRDWSIADKLSEDRFSLTIPARGYAIIIADLPTFQLSYPILPIASQNITSVNGTIGNGLNNSGDTVSLIYDQIIMESIDYPSISSNKSYARFGNDWQIVSTATPGLPNQTDIIPPPNNTPNNTNVGGEPSADNPLSNCQKISLREALNFIDKCVIISGQVKNPSGSTFYLTDEGIELKVYLQASRQIKKPRLHQGDKVQVRGIINIYKDQLRLLPQVTGDIALLQSASEAPNSTAAKNTSSKNSPNSSLIPLAQASSPDQPNDSSSSTPSPLQPLVNEVKGAKTLSNQHYLRLSLIAASLLLLLLIGYNIWKRYENNKPKSQPNKANRSRGP